MVLHRSAPHAIAFSPEHDTIFFYTKGEGWTFNIDDIRIPYKQLNIQHSSTSEGQGRIGGRLDEELAKEYRQRGKAPEDYWLESRDGMSPVGRRRSENLGYPTQKPIALLERVVRVSSNPGDLVLDPFCGCGTAVDAARRLGRRWIGIDISAFAIDLIRDKRLKDSSVPAYGIPADMEAARKLARGRPFDFEAWAVTRIPGFTPNMNRRGDGGIDGRGILVDAPDGLKSRLALAQIEGGQFSIDSFRAFARVMDRSDAAFGVYITLDPVTSPSARKEALRMGRIAIGASRYPRLMLWSISEHFAGRPPDTPPMLDPYLGKPIQGALF